MLWISNVYARRQQTECERVKKSEYVICSFEFCVWCHLFYVTSLLHVLKDIKIIQPPAQLNAHSWNVLLGRKTWVVKILLRGEWVSNCWSIQENCYIFLNSLNNFTIGELINIWGIWRAKFIWSKNSNSVNFD